MLLSLALYVLAKRQANKYHDLCYTNCFTFEGCYKLFSTRLNVMFWSQEGNVFLSI